MMKRRLNPESTIPDADPDMTPMIDVVFLLIIFFLCIDFKVLEAKLPAHLPKDAGSSRHFEPPEQLRVRILCAAGDEGSRQDRPGQEARPAAERSYHLVGHRVTYACGPENFTDLDRLRERLRILRDHPSIQVPDLRNPGKTKPMPVVVEPGAHVVYGDVALCVDVLAAMEFEDIRFGTGIESR